jgi:hypothetical protein
VALVWVCASGGQTELVVRRDVVLAVIEATDGAPEAVEGQVVHVGVQRIRLPDLIDVSFDTIETVDLVALLDALARRGWFRFLLVETLHGLFELVVLELKELEAVSFIVKGERHVVLRGERFFCHSNK